MAALGQRTRFAPPQTAQVDWSHPLAAGLQAIGCGLTRYATTLATAATNLPNNGAGVRGPSATPVGMGVAPAAAAGDGGWAWRTPITTPSSMTLFALVNQAAAAAAGLAVAWNGNTDSGFGIGIADSTGGTGSNLYGLDGGVAHRGTSVTIAGTGWRFIAASVTNGGGNLTYYVDGVQVASTTSNYNTSTPSFVVLGGQWWLQRGFQGSIGAWGAYSRRLSAAEHAALYADPFQMLRW